MGRSVSTLENMVGFDPYAYAQRRQQLFNAPVAQAQNPYERMGAALGNIVGGTVFGLEDPILKRASDINRIYSDVMAGTDPTKPDFADRLGALTSRLSEAGYGDAAMYAANQARTVKREEAAETRAASAEGRAVSAEGRAVSAERRASYQFNPALAIEDAGKLPENSPERLSLLTLASRLMAKETFDQAVKVNQIKASEADAIYKRALAGRAEKETAAPIKTWERAGVDALGNVTLFNPFTGETKVLKGTLSDTPGAATPAKPAGERRSLDDIAKGSGQPAGVPEARRATGLSGVIDENERLNPRRRTTPSNSTWEMPF